MIDKKELISTYLQQFGSHYQISRLLNPTLRKMMNSFLISLSKLLISTEKLLLLLKKKKRKLNEKLSRSIASFKMKALHW